MSDSKKNGPRTIKTGMIPVVEFAKRVRGKNSEKAYEANANLITDVYVPLYGGESGRYPGGGTLSVNLGKTSNVPENLLEALGTKQKEPCAYKGGTPEGTPVTIDTYVRTSEQDPAKRNCVQLTMDLQAVSVANAAEREKIRKERGQSELPRASLERINVELKSPVTDSGIGVMSTERFIANFENMAAQNYLMTTPGPTKAQPDNTSAAMKYLPTEKDVKDVSTLYAVEFMSFARRYAEHGCDGVRPLTRNEEGKLVEDKDHEPIPGTGFASLKEMGFALAPMKDGPGVAIVCVDGSKNAAQTRNGEQGLRAFNKAFGEHMRQLMPHVNEIFDFDMSQRARIMAANTSIEVYPRTVGGKVSGQLQAEKEEPELSMGGGGAPSAGDWRPNWLKDGGFVQSDVEMTVLQPMVKYNVRSFARALTTSIECATEQNTRPVEEIYGPAVLHGAESVRHYYPADYGEHKDPDKVIQSIVDVQPKATTMYVGPTGP